MPADTDVQTTVDSSTRDNDELTSRITVDHGAIGDTDAQLQSAQQMFDSVVTSTKSQASGLEASASGEAADRAVADAQARAVEVDKAIDETAELQTKIQQAVTQLDETDGKVAANREAIIEEVESTLATVKALKEMPDGKGDAAAKKLLQEMAQRIAKLTGASASEVLSTLNNLQSTATQMLSGGGATETASVSSPSGGGSYVGAAGGGDSGGGGGGAATGGGGAAPSGGSSGGGGPAAGQGTGGVDMDVVKTIWKVGKEMGVSDKVMLAAMETGLVESNMQNLNHGDRDSLGVFQQRPSQGWGSADQVTNVEYAAKQFFERAVESEKSNGGLSPGMLADSVQRSAFPERYDQREADAKDLIDQMQNGGDSKSSGGGGGASTASSGGSGGEHAQPAEGQVTSGVGPRWGDHHDGLDIANDLGTDILAAEGGKVINAGPASGYGNWVQIEHADGTVATYGHMSEYSVKVGDTVEAGQHIAEMGSEGQSTGSHLHFQLEKGGSIVDPEPWLKERGVGY